MTNRHQLQERVTLAMVIRGAEKSEGGGAGGLAGACASMTQPKITRLIRRKGCDPSRHTRATVNSRSVHARNTR